MGKKKTLELLEKFKNFVNSNNSESESDGEIEATKPIKIKETTKPIKQEIIATEPNIPNILDETPTETPTEKKKRIQSEAQKLNTQKMREKLKEAHQKRAIEKEQARIEEQRIIDEKIIKKAIELKRKQLKKEKILDEEYVPISASVPQPHVVGSMVSMPQPKPHVVGSMVSMPQPKPSGLILNFKKK